MEDTFIERLRSEVDHEVITLMGVATHDLNIQDQSDYYKARRRRISSALRRLGLEDPNQWPDLWLWYGYYKDNGLDSYQSRREFIIRHYQPLRDALDRWGERTLGTGLEVPETGWSEIDRLVKKLRTQYANAHSEEDHRAVGLLCRDIFIQLGRTVFNPAEHTPEGQPVPRRSDAKARIDAAVLVEVPGSSADHLRQVARATCAFVQEVVHVETDTDRKAHVAAEATIHLVSVLHILIPSPVGPGPEDDDRDEDLLGPLPYDYSDEEVLDPADEEYYLGVLQQEHAAGRLSADEAE